MKKEEKEPAAEVVVMGEPEQINVEVPAVEEKGKKRKRQDKEDKAAVKELEQNLSILLKTGFEMLALRDPVWKVQDAEIEAVAKPGARILNRLGAAEEANKNADYFLLAVGLAMIVIPRVLMIKAREKAVKEGGRPERKAAEGHGSAAETRAGNAPGNVKYVLPGLA